MQMHAVWDSHPLNLSSSQATRSDPGKSKSYKPKALNEIHEFSPPFQPKRKKFGHEKRGDPH